MARQKYAKKTKFSQIFFSTPTQKLNVWFLCPLPKVVKFITPSWFLWRDQFDHKETQFNSRKCSSVMPYII